MITQYEFDLFRNKVVKYIDYLASFCDVSIKAIEKYKPENSELMNEVTKIQEELILLIKKTNTDEDIKHLDNLGKRLDRIQSNLRSDEEIDRYILDLLKIDPRCQGVPRWPR